MQTYRAYFVAAEETAFEAFEEFKAVDDSDALRTAARLVNGNAVVLWDGSRLIGMLKPARRRRDRFGLSEGYATH
jgi:hypothetical protein